jgi:hypothetical protein
VFNINAFASGAREMRDLFPSRKESLNLHEAGNFQMTLSDDSAEPEYNITREDRDTANFGQFERIIMLF